MAGTVEALISSTMNNPDVAAIGMVIGFILAKALGMRNRRRNQFP
ncbi:MAG: hypothetical protein ABEJ98_05975 [Candidatus Nanohaloarchaea archaeon]